MNKKILVTIILLSCILTLSIWSYQNKLTTTIYGFSKPEKIRPLEVTDFEFNGIKPGQTYNRSNMSLIQILGKPNRIKEKDLKENQMIAKKYIYSSFELNTYIHEDIEEIDSIVILKSNIKTKRSLKVGDPEEFILEKYGRIKKISGIYRYEFESNELKTANYGIGFYVNNGRIQKIIIYQASIL